ncbi:MAG: flagellar hook protein FlgE [Ignavibacteriota bacterium]
MFPTLSVALSALTADQTAISVTGNNLANLNTTGFKASTVQFSDLMSEMQGVGAGTQVGMGVGQVQTSSLYTQGSTTNTGAPLDAAIQGNGFFVVTDPSSNQQLYTRDGAFQLSPKGDLQTATGQLVQGWSAVNGVVNSNGPVGNLTVPVGSVIPATPTANMNATINLNAGSPVGTNFTAPIQIYDSLGQAHTATITFTQDGGGSWDYAVSLPDSDFSSPPGGPLATGTLQFDGSGNLIAPASTDGPVTIAITGLADNANELDVNWNLFDASGNQHITQYAEASGTSNPQQDGAAAGQVTDVSLANGGLVVATYSNGAQVTIGQIALASIANPQSLLSVGDNNLALSALSAAPAIGAANTGGLGGVVAGSLEASTVDIATEFTHLISLQQAYQANSKIVTTVDQLTQTTIGLIQA